MSMLTELVEVVIGVDTHTDTHTAAVVAASTGAVLAVRAASADPSGDAELVALATVHGGLRAWAVEGTGRLRRRAGSSPCAGRGTGRRAGSPDPPDRRCRKLSRKGARPAPVSVRGQDSFVPSAPAI